MGPATVARSSPGARPTAGRFPVVRLDRHVVTTASGRRVGVAMAGTGMPLVVAHGFAAQGILYAQTLSRLVSMGFMVVAVDVAGHGATPLPPLPAVGLTAYRDEFLAAVDALGIRRAVFMGHSMGGRIVVEVAAARPEAVVALALVDSVVGGPWDDQIAALRRSPASAAGLALRLVGDAVSLIDHRDPTQTAKILSLLVRSNLRPRIPAGLLAPAVALILSGPSDAVLRRVAGAGIASFVIHGSHDKPVPLACARAAAARLEAELVVVRGARHSWLLSDPETLPAICGQLLKGRLGDAWSDAVTRAGLDPAVASLSEIQAAMLHPASLASYLATTVEFVAAENRRGVRYDWETQEALIPAGARS